MNFKSLLAPTPAFSLVSYHGPLDGTEGSVAGLVGVSKMAIPQGYTGTAITNGGKVPGFSAYAPGTELYVKGNTWAIYSELPIGTWTRLLGTVDHRKNLRLHFGAVMRKA